MTTPHPAPYGTPDVPRISVRGEATLEAEPELARIGITVTARGTGRATVLDDLTRRNTAALTLIKEYGDAVEKLETGTLVITPEIAKGRGERVRTHHGRVHLTATLGDFTALGELTTRLADLELTGVGGPWWSLRPDSPAHRTARIEAVHDAVRRAREYAHALGGTLVAMLELADEGAQPATAYRHRAYGSVAIAAPPPGGQAPALDLEPERQTVHAQVIAHFTMTPPNLTVGFDVNKP